MLTGKTCEIFSRMPSCFLIVLNIAIVKSDNEFAYNKTSLENEKQTMYITYVAIIFELKVYIETLTITIIFNDSIN